MPRSAVADGAAMLAPRPLPQPARLTLGLPAAGPVVALAALFAFVGARAGVPVALAALLGGVGGTASLVAHEFGHVFVARRLPGIRSASVSLLWLGAAVRFEGRYETGGQQARVALAGPQTSLGLAVPFVAACYLPLPASIEMGLLLLALFNVALAVLNLVPVAPLDGHKLVVAALWSAMGSEQRARRILRRIGIALGVAELPGAAVLLVERPGFGLVVVVGAAAFYAQRHFTRSSPRRLSGGTPV
jgi:Zn-dependent protease